MQHTEIKLKSKEIFKGNVFRVTMDQVELENGMTSFREVVHHNGGPGACAPGTFLGDVQSELRKGSD